MQVYLSLIIKIYVYNGIWDNNSHNDIMILRVMITILIIIVVVRIIIILIVIYN